MIVDQAVIDDVHEAAKRYYLALQMYTRALRILPTPENAELLRAELQNAFALLMAAQDNLTSPELKLENC